MAAKPKKAPPLPSASAPPIPPLQSVPPAMPNEAASGGAETARKFLWLPEGSGDRIFFYVASAGLLIVLYLLFFYNRYDGPASATLVGTISTEFPLRRRHAKTLHWHDINGKQPVFLRDIVYVPKGASAVVTFVNGRTLNLKPDSMVQFDEVTVDGVEVTLFDFGLFRLMPYPKISRSTLLPDPRPLELRHSEFSQRLADHLRRPLRLESTRPVKYKPFSLDRLTDYTIILVRPEAKVYNLLANRWLQTVWTPVPVKAKFELQIGQDKNFRRFVTHRPADNKLLIQFDLKGKYYWRVKAVQGDEWIMSKMGTFEFSETTGIKTRVILTSPPNKKDAVTP